MGAMSFETEVNADTLKTCDRFDLSTADAERFGFTGIKVGEEMAVSAGGVRRVYRLTAVKNGWGSFVAVDAPGKRAKQRMPKR
jgi:hypothetical protein